MFPWFFGNNIILTPAFRKGVSQNSYATCLKTTTFNFFQREVADMLCDKNTVMAIQPDLP